MLLHHLFGIIKVPSCLGATVPPLDPNPPDCSPRDLSIMVDRLLAYSKATLEVF